MINTILSLLNGRKTYLGTALLFCVGGALYLGWINTQIAAALALIIGALTGAALRASISKK